METLLRADTHCHTRHSDGEDTVPRTVEKARAAGLGLVTVTDHDTVNRDAAAALREAGIATCEAVEVSARDARAGHDLHVLCYAHGVSERIWRLLAPVAGDRGGWEAKLAELRLMGFRGTMEGLEDWKRKNGCRGVTCTRHFRAYLFGEPGNADLARRLARAEDLRRRIAGRTGLEKKFLEVATPAAFHRLLWSDDAPLATSGKRENRPKVDLEALAAAARASGAFLSVAHPNFSFKKFGGPEGWAARLDRYAELGIEGVELNPFAKPEWVAAIREQAEKRGLIVTFGSDSHGPRDSTHGTLGELHPETERDRAWYAANVRRFLERIGLTLEKTGRPAA
jgi:predicted metal-dependent phosphoesterase TrpH